MFDFAIIGGGPAGSMAALQLSRKGYKTVVFEEHNSIGLPVRCAGLVSENVIKMHKEGILNEIKGAIVVFPNGKETVIGGDRTHAFVIDRHIFDKSLAEKAMAEGAEYRTGKKVRRIAIKNQFFEIEDVKAEKIVGADGPKSFVASRFSMGNIKFFNAIQGYGDYEIDPNYVKIFLSQKIAPGFFAWIVPAEKARIGLATTEKNIASYFKKFLKAIDGKVDSLTSGLIPFGMRKMHAGRIALIGDAAGQVKATSGGGLYGGLLAAITLAKNAENFAAYEKEYMNSFGKELKKCIYMRKFVNLFGDAIWKWGYRVAKQNIPIINQYGDIDYPSIVIKEIIRRNPLSFIKFEQ